MNELQAVVQARRSLRSAKVISTTTFAEGSGQAIHGFLLLELRLDSVAFWLRLDRRMSYIFQSSQSVHVANDIVSLLPPTSDDF